MWNLIVYRKQPPLQVGILIMDDKQKQELNYLHMPADTQWESGSCNERDK